MAAPSRSTVVTPLTSLLVAMQEAGYSQPEEKIKAALGISPSLRLNRTDAIKAVFVDNNTLAAPLLRGEQQVMALVVQTASYLAQAPGDIPAVAAFAWTAIGKSIEDSARDAAAAAAAAAAPAPAAGGGGSGRLRQALASGGGVPAVGRGRRLRMLHQEGEDGPSTDDYYEYDSVMVSEARVDRRRLLQEGPVEFEPPLLPPSPLPPPPPQPPVRFNLTDPTYIASVLNTTLQLMGAARNGSSSSGGGSGGNTTQSVPPPPPPPLPAVQPNEDGVLNATLRDAATDSMAHMQQVIAGAVASSNLTDVVAAATVAQGNLTQALRQVAQGSANLTTFAAATSVDALSRAVVNTNVPGPLIPSSIANPPGLSPRSPSPPPPPPPEGLSSNRPPPPPVGQPVSYSPSSRSWIEDNTGGFVAIVVVIPVVLIAMCAAFIVYRSRIRKRRFDVELPFSETGTAAAATGSMASPAALGSTPGSTPERLSPTGAAGFISRIRRISTPERQSPSGDARVSPSSSTRASPTGAAGFISRMRRNPSRRDESVTADERYIVQDVALEASLQQFSAAGGGGSGGSGGSVPLTHGSAGTPARQSTVTAASVLASPQGEMTSNFNVLFGEPGRGRRRSATAAAGGDASGSTATPGALRAQTQGGDMEVYDSDSEEDERWLSPYGSRLPPHASADAPDLQRDASQAAAMLAMQALGARGQPPAAADSPDPQPRHLMRNYGSEVMGGATVGSRQPSASNGRQPSASEGRPQHTLEIQSEAGSTTPVAAGSELSGQYFTPQGTGTFATPRVSFTSARQPAAEALATGGSGSVAGNNSPLPAGAAAIVESTSVGAASADAAAATASPSAKVAAAGRDGTTAAAVARPPGVGGGGYLSLTTASGRMTGVNLHSSYSPPAVAGGGGSPVEGGGPALSRAGSDATAGDPLGSDDGRDRQFLNPMFEPVTMYVNPLHDTPTALLRSSGGGARP